MLITIYNRLQKFLSQPYPFYYQGRLLITSSLILFISVFLFNYLIEPFEVNVQEHRMPFVFICLIHALIPAIIYWLCFSRLQKIPGLDERWNVGREIIVIVSLLLLIGIVQFLIRDVIYNNPNNWSWRYFYEEIRNALLVGALFSCIFVPANFNRLYRLNRSHAEALPEVRLPQDVVTGKFIPIQTQVRSDDFLLDAGALLFARAEKNYVEIYLDNDGLVHKLLKRISMKELEAQLAGLPFLLKTHRSYLVNLLVIEEVSGNAQGYRLRLKQCDEAIPVSRNLIAAFEEKRKSL
ncbi:LytTR family transcriptional regulator [Terrimonas sp. NA20]|uniref:LytTR family transcriptional regulator n=1 Tax=Terrimonas ginsenosidimutans TaxID=2908004 RepID=A0ABS9KWI8_9BACT|nr:LytTR family DNA-binding domain-containing protein [Terrimonas ginsenosidimutans]MCG2616722.1 LytTR family transcriptional regulator [Terrimonas ginsenosidimutans]